MATLLLPMPSSPWLLLATLPQDLPVLRVPERTAEVAALPPHLLLGHEVGVGDQLLLRVVLRGGERGDPGGGAGMTVVRGSHGQQVVNMGVVLGDRGGAVGYGAVDCGLGGQVGILGRLGEGGGGVEGRRGAS